MEISYKFFLLTGTRKPEKSANEVTVVDQKVEKGKSRYRHTDPI